MSKKIICFILAMLMLIVSFAGCAKKEVTPDTTTDSTQETQEETTAPAPTSDISEEAFTLNVDNWFMNTDPAVDKDGRVKAYQLQVEKIFKEKYPNATVQWNLFDGLKYFDIEKAKIASGTTGDIFYGQSFGAANFLNLCGTGGYVTDLSDQPWASDMLDVAKTFSTYNGKVIAAPGNVSGWGAWYNKKIFKDNGLELPKTWAEFLTICETLKSKDIEPLATGFKDQWPAVGFYITMANSLLYSADPTIEINLTKGDKKITTDPAISGILTKFQELVTKEYISKNSLSTTYEQANMDFIQGKAAMTFNGSWTPGYVAAEPAGANFELGFMPIPDDAGNITMTSTVDLMMFLSSASKLQVQGKDFIIASKDPTALQILLVNQSASPLKSVTINHTLPAFKEYADAFVKYPTNLQPFTLLPGSVQTDIMNECLKIAAGKEFDIANLDKMQSDLELDKGTITLPE